MRLAPGYKRYAAASVFALTMRPNTARGSASGRRNTSTMPRNALWSEDPLPKFLIRTFFFRSEKHRQCVSES